MQRPSNRLPDGRAAGFTLVELMLAMAFISVLLLSITMVAIQAGRLYNRGVVLRDVNQAGRDISDTLRRDFLQTNAEKITKVDDQPVIIIRNGGTPVSGRFCLGGYSYVWNYAAALDNERLRAGSGIVHSDDGQPINLARVVDWDGGLCAKAANGSYPATLTSGETTQLLKSITRAGEGTIGLHRLTLAKVSKADGPKELYRLNFTLGTSVIAEINTSDGTCRPPADDQSNLEFCAVNSFDMIVRTND